MKGGLATPAPNEPTAPLSLQNARGAILERAHAKSHAKILGAEVAPVLSRRGKKRQSGAMAGTEVHHLAIKHLREHAIATGTSLAGLFTDDAAAFYATLCEELLGCWLEPHQRRRTLATLGLK